MEKLLKENASKLDVASLSLDIQKTNLKVDRQLSQVDSKVKDLAILRKNLLEEQLKFMDGMIAAEKKVGKELNECRTYYRNLNQQNNEISSSLKSIEKSQKEILKSISLLNIRISNLEEKGIFERIWELFKNSFNSLKLIIKEKTRVNNA